MSSSFLNNAMCTFLIVTTFGLKASAQHEIILSGTAFQWGINGHPFTQHDYRQSTWKQQFLLLKDLGVNVYRIDMPLISNGLARNDRMVVDFFDGLADINVKPMPVVFPSEKKGLKDSLDAYETYFSQGKSFAERYGDWIEVMEVGNEWDVRAMNANRNVDGMRKSHYDKSLSREVMWILKGFIDGVKAVKPKMSISVSLIWTHLYYLDMLAYHGVDYDIIGYHWYSNMGNLFDVRPPYGDLLGKVKNKYKKEIWVTELNTKEGTRKIDEEEQEKYLRINLEQLLEQGIINGFFIYELFDQPALESKYPQEARYGLTFHKDGIYKKKPAYSSFKALISRSKAIVKD